MEGMGLKFTPVRGLLGHLSMFGPIWLALLGLIASPNSPNEGFNPSPAFHPPPPPTPPLSSLPTPYNAPSAILK